MMECSHGLILYGNKCLLCEREKKNTIEICKKTIKAIEADIVELRKELKNIIADNLERENRNRMKGIIDPFNHYNICERLTQSIIYAKEIIEDLTKEIKR